MIGVEDMRRHVTELGETHDIEFMWCRRPDQAWADRAHATVCIAPIRSAVSYATALHEIGHVVGRCQLSRDSMVRERWAWRWAQANALLWTPRMERDRRRSLASARRWRGIRPPSPQRLSSARGPD